ncbi:MAG: hypothetical protein SV487_04620 [Thermodesulfobacteriota bacterium]|nr:hypothetical protein [Thermodesulfobacteriota bacterium]
MAGEETKEVMPDEYGEPEMKKAEVIVPKEEEVAATIMDSLNRVHRRSA